MTVAIPAPPSSTAPSPDASISVTRRVLDLLFGPLHQRTFSIRLWDGSVYEPPEPVLPFTLVFARRGALRRMLLPPSEVAIGEAFVRGDVDIDGDLESAITLGDLVSSRLRSGTRLLRLLSLIPRLPRDDYSAPPLRRVRGLRQRGLRHVPGRDALAVRFHYDLGNDFYRLWLDSSLAYSCAYFQRGNEPLDAAQEAKLDYVCRKLRLQPDHRLLDIGCGWGALVLHAAARYRVHALGITLSEEQAREARARIQKAGLSDRCRIEVRDYRQLDAAGEFDRVASVGMVEHVGLRRLHDYFAAVYGYLKPGGLFLNHGIVSVARSRPKTLWRRIEHRLWRRDTFINRYVFPDGKLVPAAAVIANAERAGFETRDVESLREHYIRTLRHWVKRLEARAEDAIALVGEPTLRVWRLYLSGSAHGFASARNNIIQTLLVKPGPTGESGLPLTRDWLYT